METRKPIKVCVIGTGPTGLAFLNELLEEAKKNPKQPYEIHVVEKRDLDFTRGQKVIVLSDPTSNTGIRWDDFCVEHFFPKEKLTLDHNANLLVNGKIPEEQDLRYKFVQKILRQPLGSTYPRNFSIKQLQSALLENINKSKVKDVEIKWHQNTVVDSIDLNTNQIQLSNNDPPINFDILVDCEGESRETLKKINQSLAKTKDNKSPTFEFGRIGSEPTYHMAIKMKIIDPGLRGYQELLETERERYQKDPNIEARVMLELSEKVEVENEELEIIDLPFLFDPNMYKENLAIPNWVPKFFVVGAIPKEIHEIADPEQKRQVLEHWASYLLAEKFKISPDNFTFDDTNNPELDKKRALTFIEFPTFVINPVISLSNGGVIAVLGDAALSANYWRGISSTIGLNEAITMAKAIGSQQYTRVSEVYNKYLALIMKEVGRPVSFLIDIGATGGMSTVNTTREKMEQEEAESKKLT